MNESLPKPLQAFIEKYPEIWNAYEKLGHECHVAGPLDEKTRRLVKSVSLSEHVWKALYALMLRGLSKGGYPKKKFFTSQPLPLQRSDFLRASQL